MFVGNPRTIIVLCGDNSTLPHTYISFFNEFRFHKFYFNFFSTHV
jgi:hypothetical protein